MLDLHSHILPGIDDGPQTMADSLALARAYVQAGFKAVVATPHAIAGTTWMPAVPAVLDKAAAFNQALTAHQIPLTIYSGMEIAFDGSIAPLLANGRLLPLANSIYVLMECPFQRFPLGWERVFFEVLAAGYKILLAHPERCDQIVGDPLFMDALAGAGAYFQINGDSFLGAYGRPIQKTALVLAARGAIHCLATDSHDPVHRSPIHFAAVRAAVEKQIGRENTDLITVHNPARVLTGADLVRPAPAPTHKPKKWWVFW